jgi:LysM repeat protein
MIHQAYFIAAVTVLLCFTALTSHGLQDYLYTPHAVVHGEKPQDGGLLVRELTIKQGDTLSGLSKKYIGRGMYYPQILLFNDIKNPDLIHTGDTLKIPLPSTAVSATKAPAKQTATRLQKKHAVSERKSGEAKEPDPRITINRAIDADGKKLSSGPPLTVHNNSVSLTGKKEPVVSAASDGQKNYEQAVKAYRQDDFRAALKLFEIFLAENPTSPLAADASLFKAECYLKLSSQ